MNEPLIVISLQDDGSVDVYGGEELDAIAWFKAHNRELTITLRDTREDADAPIVREAG